MHLNVPASVQLFLFADKLVPADTPFAAATRLSYSQKKVKTNELATYLLAFMTWDLYQTNSVNLEVQNGKKLFFIPTEKLWISLKKDLPVSGNLENWLVSGLENEEELSKVLHALLKVDEAWPHKKIIHIVSTDACGMGLGKTRDNNSKMSSFLSGMSGDIDFEVERGLVSEIEPLFDLKVQQWNQFITNSPKIAGFLITACRAALNSRVLQND